MYYFEPTAQANKFGQDWLDFGCVPISLFMNCLPNSDVIVMFMEQMNFAPFLAGT